MSPLSSLFLKLQTHWIFYAEAPAELPHCYFFRWDRFISNCLVIHLFIGYLTLNFLTNTEWPVLKQTSLNDMTLIYPRTGHQGPEGAYSYSSNLSFTSAVDEVGGWGQAPANLRPPPCIHTHTRTYARIRTHQCARRHTHTHTHTHTHKYLLHANNGFVKAPHCFVIPYTLYV